MQEKRKKYSYYYEPEREKYSYRNSETDSNFLEYPKKRISKDNSEKHFKTLDNSLRDINNRRFNKINKKSMWGSKAQNAKNSITNKIKSNSINYLNTINNNIKKNITKEKKENKRLRKRNTILKCLIEFKRSRREVYAEYFDIWFDKTYYYDITPEPDYKNSNKNYDNFYDYDKYEKNEKKYKKEIQLNDIPKKSKKKEKKYDTNYYTYSNMYYIDEDFKNPSKGKYNDNKRYSKDKYDNYKTLSKDRYKSTSYFNLNNKNNNKYKNNTKETTKSKKKEKEKYIDDMNDFNEDYYYYSDSFNDEYKQDKIKIKEKTKQNKYNKNKKEKKNKTLNKKLLYLLTKYLIDRKEKAQCFYKWVNNLSSIYFYNGKEAFNDMDTKNQLKLYNNMNNDKNKNKNIQYRIEKYYDDYEETPQRETDEDNNVYIYNENKKFNKINEYFKIKNNILEEHNKSNNNRQDLNSNRYNDYDTTIMTHTNDNEEKNSNHNKNKNFNIIEKQIRKELKPKQIKQEKKIYFNFSNINKNLIRGNEYFAEGEIKGIESPFKYTDLDSSNNNNNNNNNNTNNKIIQIYNVKDYNNKENELKKNILISILKKYKYFKLFNYFEIWFDITFNNEPYFEYEKLNNNTQTQPNNKMDNKIKDKENDKNKSKKISDDHYLYIGNEYIKSKNKNENNLTNNEVKDYFKIDFKEQSISEYENNEKQNINSDNNLHELGNRIINDVNEIGNKMIYKEKFNTIEHIKEKIIEKNKKENNINLDNLSKKERRIYKKYKKAMHNLRKAIRSYKKRKKKGLLVIKKEDLLLKYFKKWKKVVESTEETPESNEISYNTEENEIFRKEKLKNAINIVNNKLKTILLKNLKIWHNIALIITKNIIKNEVNNLEKSKKRINIKQINENKNGGKVFHKKNISRKKIIIKNNTNNPKRIIINDNINRKNINVNVLNKIHTDYNQNYNKDDSLDLNKKIKFSISKSREKNQIIVFNNFNIKDINGRKEIIINKTVLPKNKIINDNQPNIQVKNNINNKKPLTNKNNKKKLINLFNKINIKLIKYKYFKHWFKKATKVRNYPINKKNSLRKIIVNELKSNNPKYENKNVRSNSRTIVIRQEPLDLIDKEKIMNKSYTKNDIKFNYNSSYNKIEPIKNDYNSNNNIINLNVEDKKIKTKNNKNFKEKETPNPNINNDNEEDSSALMEDPSEINTIYSIHNFQKITNSQQHVNINNYNNIDTNNVIEEEKESKKMSKENISKNNNKNNKILLPYIYKLSFFNNNAMNLTLNVLKNCNEKLFNMINSENYAKILEKNQKLLSSYQIYCFYSLLNNGKNFYRLKYRFKKWKELASIFNNKEKPHIKNSNGHCLGCNCKNINMDFNKNYNNYHMCFHCICYISKSKIKRALMRHKFMRELNPKRYYLFLWYKNVFNKIRNINI